MEIFSIYISQRPLSLGSSSQPQTSSMMSQYGYVSSSHCSVDMSSYVAITGKPEANHCSVFGLTPQELRYLKVGIIIPLIVTQ